MSSGLSRRGFSGMVAAASALAPSWAGAQPAAPRAMGGLQEAVLSVFDFDQIVRPFTEVCGYKLTALPDAPREQFAAWCVPPACTRIEQALMTAEDAPDVRGALRLVKFYGVPQKVMRSSQRSWDTGGIFDVDTFSNDVERIYRGLQAHGWTALGDPVDYTEAKFTVRQVVAVGPDGLMLAIIQRYSPPVSGLPADGKLTPVFNSTQMVSDYAAARRFYVETLGWTAALEFPIENAAEPGADVLGLPMPQARAADRQIGMFHPPGGGEGAVELIQNKSMTGKDFAADCVAPNVGLLALRFQVADARAYAEAIVARGGPLYVPPTRLTVAPLGPVTSFSIRSPDGAIIEFFQAD